MEKKGGKGEEAKTEKINQILLLRNGTSTGEGKASDITTHIHHTQIYLPPSPQQGSSDERGQPEHLTHYYPIRSQQQLR